MAKVGAKTRPFERGFVRESAELALGAFFQSTNEFMLRANGGLDPGILNPSGGHDLATFTGASQ